MAKLKVLNSREIKAIMQKIKAQWDTDAELDYTFLENNEQKIFIVNKQIAEISLEKLRVNSVGNYFGQLSHEGIRLSIEGSQLIGEYVKKNVAEITEEQVKDWLRGEDVIVEGDFDKFIILKHGSDFLGSGKYQRETKKALNFVPKARRVKAI